MITPLRSSSLAWFAVPLGALVFLVWLNAVRIRHIEDVSAQGGGSAIQTAPNPVAASPAPEIAAGNRLVVPEQTAESYHWIAQTQRMFLRGEWRVRHIDYENAPTGRAVSTPSPYRWWLGLVAWGDHVISGRPAAQAVERAALVADPLLHTLLLLGTALFVAWRFGAFAAALLSLGCVALFPFATEFLPGAPDDHGLVQIFSIGSVLLLAAGVGVPAATNDAGKATRRWFFLAGVIGGLGLWVSVRSQVPVLAGIGAGGLLAAWVTRRQRATGATLSPPLPWRAWAVGGAVTTLAAYLIEFAPAHLGEWQLGVIHPLYAVAWLGAGEILAQAVAWIESGKFPRASRQLAALTLAVAALAALPVAIGKVHGAEFLIPDLPSWRLTRLPEGAVAQSLGAWLGRDGATPQVLAALLPLLLLIPAGWLLLRRPTGGAPRTIVALALGPVLIALGFACAQLAWWNALDGLLLVLLVTAAGERPDAIPKPYTRLAWLGFLFVLLLPGASLLVPRTQAETEDNLTRAEVLGLIERDLGRWLALHGDPAGVVVLAPPNETTALCYYGGLRGIGTLSWENKAGVTAAVRILSAPSSQEAKELVYQRGITHLVLLSWDTTFDNFARAGTGKLEGTFRQELDFSTLPLWLRPLAYPLPAIAGFEGQSVTVYEVVEDQDEATVLGRIASYFVERGQLEQAAAAAQGLRRFPSDLGAWVARAEVEQARGDEAAFAKSLKVLQGRLAAKTAPTLPWDQRVGLAVVLAKAKQETLAREQVRLCLVEADAKNLRSLSPGALYRLLVLSRAFGQALDLKLHDLALALVPPELRERLR